MNTLRFASITFLCSASILSGCHNTPPIAAPPPAIMGLSTGLVTESQVPNSTTATGILRAEEDSVLSAQMMGRVTAVTVRGGDAVRAGETLLKLDNAQSQSEVTRAKASTVSYEQDLKVSETESALAASTLQRYELLRDRRSVSPQEFDEVQRRSQVASARVDAARAQLAAAKANESGSLTASNYARVTAPFDGRVTARHVDPGGMAMPGVPLLEVEKAGALQLQVNVDESLVRTLQKGMAVGVNVPALPAPVIDGRVAEVDPAGDTGSHSFLVKIDLPVTAGLRSGMFGTASIADGSRPAVLVPKSAVVLHGSLATVWVVDSSSIAALRYVTLGASEGDAVEALSGLSSGERVVLAPQDRELGGRKIEVQP